MRAFTGFFVNFPWKSDLNLLLLLTLVAISKLLPDRPAFSLGLTCLALILGALPAFYTGPAKTTTAIIAAFAGVLISAAIMHRALNIYFDRMIPQSKSKTREV